MGYQHIDNLYKNQDILLFKECYALQKVHGTSAHIKYSASFGLLRPEVLTFFSGGASHTSFTALFNREALLEKFRSLGQSNVSVFGEAYGGSMQGMSDTYGKQLRFVAFDVKVGDSWLSVPQAEEVAIALGLDFVHYTKVSTDLASLDAARDAHSMQAIKNGVGEGKEEEGVVLRPLIELTKNNGARIICKHKRPKFRETATVREVSTEQLQVLSEANEVAEEWVTHMRIQHILGKIESPELSMMPHFIRVMKEDVKREGEGEIIWSKEVENAISKRTAALVKETLTQVKL